MGRNVEQSGDSGSEACVSPTSPEENTIPLEQPSEEQPLKLDGISKSGDSFIFYCVLFL